MATKIWVGTDSGNEGDWATNANWSPSGVPVSTDDVILANTSQSVLDGFAQSAVSLASLTIDASFTGTIGALESDFLAIGTAKLEIGKRRAGIGTFAGSKRLNLDLGTVACVANIYSTSATSLDQNRNPLRIKCNNASTTINVEGGLVSIADNLSDTSTVDTVQSTGGTIIVGGNVTIEKLTNAGGNITCLSPVTVQALCKGGQTVFDDGVAVCTIADLDVADGALVNYLGGGTITDLELRGGTLDLTGSLKSKTITTSSITHDAVFIFDTAKTTFTNATTYGSNKIFTLTVKRK